MPPSPVQSRWYSEPVRLLTLDSKIFAKNAKGYPVLTRAHQSFISRMVRLRSVPWFLLCDVSPIAPVSYDGASNVLSASAAFPSLAEAATNPHLKDPAPHLSYMRNLQTKQPPLSDLDRFGAGYQDYLQAPLQPLTVNLESITYEVFEKDPIKYAWYERAVARALHDWIEQGKPTSNPDGRVVVAVVGAGRGPLVTRALKASQDVDVEIDMWALEKNPNAFVLLQRHNETTWNHRVNLVKSDMRAWRGPVRPGNTPPPRRIFNTEEEEQEQDEAVAEEESTEPSTAESLDLVEQAKPIPYKIDILISELLGSFADNELSPECLDGVQHLMNPVHGISIPSSYTAHITPIAAPKLYADINHGLTSTTPHAAEIPYVVMLNAIDFLSTTTSSSLSSSSSSSSSPLSPARSPVASPAPAASTTSQPLSPTIETPYSKVHSISQPSPPPPPPSSPPISIPPASSQSPEPTPVIGTTWSFQHPNTWLPNPEPFTTTVAAAAAATSSSSVQIHTEPTRSNAHNARSSTLTFPIPHRGTCHGLAGYFETVLYKGVELSTNPNTMDAKSEGMISWFPIFFPLKVCVVCICWMASMTLSATRNQWR